MMAGADVQSSERFLVFVGTTESQMSARDLVRKHMGALLAEADELRKPRDVVGRMLLSEVTQLWLDGGRSVPDVASELKFVVDNLDPDEDYEFMRP